jgi:hypothetical protein
MCHHDETDSSGATQGNDPSPAWPLRLADTAHSGDSEPADVTLRADRTAVASTPGGWPVVDTIDHIRASLTADLERIVPPSALSDATEIPIVAGYDLIAPLGEGGMGVVWTARQANLNRLVALKMVLGDQRAGSKELIRFLAEAETVAAVKHPPCRPGVRPRRCQQPAVPGYGVSLRRELGRPARADRPARAQGRGRVVLYARRRRLGSPRLGDRAPRLEARKRPV